MLSVFLDQPLYAFDLGASEPTAAGKHDQT
jgi:hypothetical protein